MKNHIPLGVLPARIDPPAHLDAPNGHPPPVPGVAAPRTPQARPVAGSAQLTLPPVKGRPVETQGARRRHLACPSPADAQLDVPVSAFLPPPACPDPVPLAPDAHKASRRAATWNRLDPPPPPQHAPEFILRRNESGSSGQPTGLPGGSSRLTTAGPLWHCHHARRPGRLHPEVYL
jgi:hypothetical protein